MNSDKWRRRDWDRMTKAEKALHESIMLIEEMPPDPNLSKAQAMVFDAMEMVSDFIDGKMSD